MIGVARIAGIQAAKRTSELIPLCHPLALSFVGVEGAIDADAGEIELIAEARTTGPTGVEMEALTAASVAALTVYDMVKGIERGAEIASVALLEKSGGRSGTGALSGAVGVRALRVAAMRAAILTVSTSVAAGPDRGPLGRGAGRAAPRRPAPRSWPARSARRPGRDRGLAARARAAGDASLIFTTGGTGLTADDVTPGGDARR